MADPIPEVEVQAVQYKEVYVGPRPFESTESNLFFGRDQEISELLSLATSSRVILCYAPSGAGKTSLINAGLQPRLEKEEFDVLPSTRVRGLIPQGVKQEEIANIYVFNAVLSLAREAGVPTELTRCTIAEFLATLPRVTDQEGFQAPRIVIFDQFEELITSYPERWQEREGFFHQIHDALETDELLRVMFVFREDYLAPIEPFTRILKPFPQSRFRLDLLGPHGAQAAVTGPLAGTGRHFKEGVVTDLIEELLKVRVETAEGEPTEVIGEYVEPVQLQVVCRNLWIKLPPEVTEINSNHVQIYGDVDNALRDFYEACLEDAKIALKASELILRDWFDEQLITPAGTRGIVFRGAELTAGLPNATVDFLENRHLIRGEWRAGSRWYELTHDRLIEPIQQANEQWRTQRHARRNRILVTLGGTVLAIFLLLGIWNNLQTPSPVQSVDATVTSAVIAAQTTAQAEINVAQEDVNLSRSRQLAAQALVEEDPKVALLLAIEANHSKDTQEARRSLHKLLSKQGAIDGNFLKKFNPEIVSPKLVTQLTNHTNWVESVVFSPDGQLFVSGSADATLILWDAATLKPVRTLTAGSAVTNVAFSPDGKLIAAAIVNERVLLWDVATGNLIDAPLTGHRGTVTCVAFSPDGKRLATGGEDNNILIWNLPVQKSALVVPQPAKVLSIAWSPDGKTLAAASAGSAIRLWDADTFSSNTVRALQGQSGIVRTLAWSPDSSLLASGSASQEGKPSHGEVIVWDVASRRAIARPDVRDNEPVRAVAFNSTGKILAIGQDDGSIRLWDARSQQILGEPIQAHNHNVVSLAFSPDGRYMLSGSIDKKIGIWDLFAPTKSIAISRSGKVLATSQGATISLWDTSSDMSTPVKILYGHTDDVLALAFTPDESALASSGLDGTIRLWNTQTGDPLGPPLSSGVVLSLDISPDGKTLASGHEDGTVLLWNLATQDQGHGMPGKRKAVMQLSFAEDGKTLQAISRDGSLSTWDLTSNNTEVTSLRAAQGGPAIASAAFAPDGQRAAFSQADTTALLSDDQRAHGIELSYWDQTVNPGLQPEDIDFVVMRATRGLQVDPKFEEFLGSIQNIPIRGAQHFFEADKPWQGQADLFLSTVENKGFNFFVLDLEVNRGDSSTAFLDDAEKWLKYVQDKTQRKVVLQAGTYYISSFGSSGDWMKQWPLLVVQYTTEPDANGTPFLPQEVEDWKIWQYTESTDQGAQYGFGGMNTHLEVYNGTTKDMMKWLEMHNFSIYDESSGEFIYPDQEIEVTALNGIAFNPDNLYLAVTGEGVASILAAKSGLEITTLNLSGRKILSLNFTPDTNNLVLGTDDGTILLWDLSLIHSEKEVESTLDLACREAGRNLTRSEWSQFMADIPHSVTCPDQPLP